MKRHTEDRKIPDLIAYNEGNESPFESSSALETENFTCFGVTAQNTRALALKVIFGNGNQILIQYSRMLSPITYNGRNELALNTATLRLEVQGLNLPPLLDYVAEQRLAWIKSIDLDSLSGAIMLRQGEPEIQAIQIKSTAKSKGDTA